MKKHGVLPHPTCILTISYLVLYTLVLKKKPQTSFPGENTSQPLLFLVNTQRNTIQMAAVLQPVLQLSVSVKVKL